MWSEEKIIIKNLIQVKEQYEEGLVYINSIFNEVSKDKIKNRDMMYYCLFNKAICFYNLKRIDYTLILLREVIYHTYVLS
jgi:hypothetical protein